MRAFSVNADEATIARVDSTLGEHWAAEKIGETIVALATGAGMFTPTGDASPFQITLTVTPSEGYKMTAPKTADAGQTVEVEVDFAPGESLVETFQFEKIEAENSQLTLHVIPAILKQVGFENTVGDLQSDDGAATYSAPHWKDGDYNGTVEAGIDESGIDRNYPVAFVRNVTPELAPVVRLGASPPPEVTLKLSAISDPEGVLLQEIELAVQDTLASPVQQPAQAEEQLPDRIAFFDSKGEGGPQGDQSAFEVTWEIALAEEMIPLQETRHTLYLVAAEPETGQFGLRESLLYFACFGAATESVGDSESIALSIHEMVFKVIRDVVTPSFDRKDLRRVKPARATPDPGATRMNYFGATDPDAGPGEQFIPMCAWGACGGWARFMSDVIRIHGDIEVDAVWIAMNPTALVDGHSPDFFYVVFREPFPGTPEEGKPAAILIDSGQGPPGPPFQSGWDGHAIVKFDRPAQEPIYFDPSYGGGPYLGLAGFEADVAGFRGRKSWQSVDRYWEDQVGVNELMETAIPVP